MLLAREGLILLFPTFSLSPDFVDPQGMIQLRVHKAPLMCPHPLYYHKSNVTFISIFKA